jgi:hypothetical protein
MGLSRLAESAVKEKDQRIVDLEYENRHLKKSLIERKMVVANYGEK